ncbi:hypothetical protein C4546_02570 [Candidatus Parcubacteria bacterium]|jgi:Tfp pilus assembly protein PilN|nr:MAG: hypothetical protein C4546_02570 [Candidatus Parcubacteria bacterium]
MDSSINLLPEKDKQLKKEVKPKPPEIEMTEPKDRVFGERVVKMGGVLEFFKSIFKRKPQPLPKIKPAEPKPAHAQSIQKTAGPSGPVTKIETMTDRLGLAKPPVSPSEAPKPSGPKPVGFFRRFLNRFQGQIGKPKPEASKPAPIPAKPVIRAPRPETRKPSWTPPPTPNAPAKIFSPTLNQISKPAVPPPPPPPPPPAYKPVAPAEVKPKMPSAPLAPEQKIPEKPQTDFTPRQPILGNGLNVNLVPEEYQPKTGPKSKIYFALTLVGPAVLVAAISFGLWLYTNNIEKKLASLDEQLQQVNVEIESNMTGTLKYAQTLQQKANSVRQILNQHIYWDKFFEELEKYTLPTVTYGNMSVDVNGSVSLAATARSFDDVGRQLLIFRQAVDFVTEVNISSAARSTQATPTAGTPPSGQPAPTEEIVTFAISLKVKPEIFVKR